VLGFTLQTSQVPVVLLLTKKRRVEPGSFFRSTYGTVVGESTIGSCVVGDATVNLYREVGNQLRTQYSKYKPHHPTRQSGTNIIHISWCQHDTIVGSRIIIFFCNKITINIRDYKCYLLLVFRRKNRATFCCARSIRYLKYGFCGIDFFNPDIAILIKGIIRRSH